MYPKINRILLTSNLECMIALTCNSSGMLTAAAAVAAAVALAAAELSCS